MDEHLKDYLGVEKVIWVKEGIDPEETNGHIDDVATFIAPGVMACIWTDDPEYPFYEQCHAAYETLSNAVDAKGRKMKVYKLCMPVNPLFMDQASCDTIDADENAEPRVPDEPLIASYMNYLVTNHGVIVPQYGDENDQLAVDTLQKIYDEVWGEGVYKCVASSPSRSSSAAATSTALRSRSRPRNCLASRGTAPCPSIVGHDP